jgi:hypothetical protein
VEDLRDAALLERAPLLGGKVDAHDFVFFRDRDGRRRALPGQAPDDDDQRGFLVPEKVLFEREERRCCSATSVPSA